jgi:hypothetical protein
MNKYRRKLQIATRLCPIGLMALFFASSGSAQVSATDSPKFERNITPPAMPDKIPVDPGFVAFLEGHGVGTQNYVCRPSGSGFAFKLFTPQATLFGDNGKQLITHFFSPNPFELNADPTVVGDHPIRVTWQDSQDTSTVWAKLDQSSSDAPFVSPDAIAWLKLEVVGAQDGPTGDNTLAATKFIQRLNTSGGLAPSTGCASPSDVGNQAFVPYTADYFFYRKADQ